MGDAKNRKKQGLSDEARTKRSADQRAVEESYARRMAGTLLNQKRQMAYAAASRFTRQWVAKTWDELLVALHPLRDDAMAMAFVARSPEAYRTAMALVAFDADLTAGGVEQLAKSIVPQLPLRLWESNDKEKLERQRDDRARELAFQVYHTALSEALGDVSLLQSLTSDALIEPEELELEKGDLRAMPTVRKLGEYEDQIGGDFDAPALVEPSDMEPSDMEHADTGVEAAPDGTEGVDDAGNPLGTEYDDAGNPELHDEDVRP